MEIKTLREDSHHQQLELCKTRPRYRQGRKLTSIKAYTINNESQHLFIYGVPQINLRSELKNLCSKYGQVTSIHVVTNYKTEAFTECFHVQYERIQSARIAKRLIDNKSFYGGILHVCYAPEFESVQETRVKLQQRCKDILTRVGYGGEIYQLRKKRKREENQDYYSDFQEEDPMLQNSVNVNTPNNVNIKKDDSLDIRPICIPTVNAQDNMSNKSLGSLQFVPSALLKNCNVKKRIIFRNKKD